MGLFGLFKKKLDETKVGNVEDFISLTRSISSFKLSPLTLVSQISAFPSRM